ncbi:hypothetical protein WDU94_015552 [Cyamophila willieti]
MNLQNSRLAGVELASRAVKDGLDVVLVQAPYSRGTTQGGRVLTGIESRSCRVAKSKFDEETGRVNSAVVVLNKDLRCMTLNHLSNEYYAVMMIGGFKLALEPPAHSGSGISSETDSGRMGRGGVTRVGGRKRGPESDEALADTEAGRGKRSDPDPFTTCRDHARQRRTRLEEEVDPAENPAKRTRLVSPPLSGVGSRWVPQPDVTGPSPELRREQGPERGDLEDETDVLIIVSVYFKFNKPIEPMIEKLLFVIGEVGSRRLIFGGDVNARSMLWHDLRPERFCPRGVLLENLLASERLLVANQSGWPSTFCNTDGESNIDLTLVNSVALLRRMKNWTVHEGAVTSDHRLIIYDVCGWEQEVRNEARYNTKDVCWIAFRTELSRRLSLVPIARRADPQEDIDARVAGLTQAYRGTCEFMLKKSRGVRYRGTVWWNRRLESEKREMNRVRKKLQRARDPLAREALQRKWRDMRDRYGESVERARRKSWERQVREGLGRDHWGFIYKLCYNKLRGSTLLHSVRTRTGEYTMSINRAVEEYLDVLLPGEEAEGERITAEFELIIELLESEMPEGCEMQAYADDVAVVVCGQSRRQIEERATAAMEVVQAWLTASRIQLSESKCGYLLFGNTLQRDLTVELNWTNPPEAMRRIYTGATVPKVLYGVSVWGDALSNHHVRRRLLTLQRHCCIGIAGCKFSVSHPASQLLAGEPPLDLVASEAKVLERLRDGEIEVGEYLGSEFRMPARKEYKRVKKALREKTMEEWEKRSGDDTLRSSSPR